MCLFVLRTTPLPNSYRAELTSHFVNLFLETRRRQTKVTTSRWACRTLALIILPVPAASWFRNLIEEEKFQENHQQSWEMNSSGQLCISLFYLMLLWGSYTTYWKHPKQTKSKTTDSTLNICFAYWEAPIIKGKNKIPYYFHCSLQEVYFDFLCFLLFFFCIWCQNQGVSQLISYPWIQNPYSKSLLDSLL